MSTYDKYIVNTLNNKKKYYASVEEFYNQLKERFDSGSQSCVLPLSDILSNIGAYAFDINYPHAEELKQTLWIKRPGQTVTVTRKQFYDLFTMYLQAQKESLDSFTEKYKEISSI